MSQRTGVPTIRFDATLYTIDKRTILRLPEKASEQLPSRGQVAVQGTINGHGFQTVLEPDGYFGHWMRIDGKLQQTAALSAGDTATLEIETLKDWPEPNVPQDLETALAAAPQKIQDLWKGITPMARWEWVRWVNATQNPDTRKRRVEVSISKMKSGKRRPCCFNLAACTTGTCQRTAGLLSQRDLSSVLEACQVAIALVRPARRLVRDSGDLRQSLDRLARLVKDHVVRAARQP